LDEIELYDVAMQVEKACKKKMTSLEGQKDASHIMSKVVGLGHLSWEQSQQEPSPKTQSGIVKFFAGLLK
jgi:hypothetical protein